PVDLVARLRSVDSSERRALVAERIIHHVRRILELGSEPDPERPLSALGLDSLLSVELNLALSRDLRLDLPATEVFKGPSIRELAGFMAAVAEKHFGSPAPASSRSRIGIAPLNEVRSGTPLFLIPAGIGELRALQRIAAGIDHPCYGLEPPTAQPVETSH